MRTWSLVSLPVLALILGAGFARAQWYPLETFDSLPAWDTSYDDGGGAWALDIGALWHDVDSNGGLFGKTFVVCRIYDITATASGGMRLDYRGAIANGYGTTACVYRFGEYTATNCRDDYAADGVFNNWSVIAHSRESPHTVGTWNSVWQTATLSGLNTGGQNRISVCWVFVAAFGTTPAGWFDNLEVDSAMPVDPWMLYAE